MRRDTGRAMWRYHQVFKHPEDGRTITRRGLLAGVKLSPWKDGMIRPHERTLSAPREDRTKLLDATRVHLSQVFLTFLDASQEFERTLRQIDGGKPTLEGTTDDGTIHRVWRVSSSEIIGKIRHHMAQKKGYVLDGHHRYETMVAFRDRINAEQELMQYSSVNFGSAFLVPSDDAGLIILPTHRIVHGIEGFTKDTFLAGIRKYFRVEVVPGAAKDAAKLRKALANVTAHQATFAAIFPGDADAHMLSLDPHVDVEAEGMTGHRAVIKLDVAVLHGLVLERVLKISKDAQEKQTNLRYVKDTQATLDQIAAGQGQVGLLMNPP